MRVSLFGKVIAIASGGFESKTKEKWETLTYQVLSTFPGQLVELENITEMGRPGELVRNPDLQESFLKQQEVEICINVTVDQRGTNPQLRSRIITVNPMRNEQGGAVASSSPVKPAPVGAGAASK